MRTRSIRSIGASAFPMNACRWARHPGGAFSFCFGGPWHEHRGQKHNPMYRKSPTPVPEGRPEVDIMKHSTYLIDHVYMDLRGVSLEDAVISSANLSVGLPARRSAGDRRKQHDQYKQQQRVKSRFSNKAMRKDIYREANSCPSSTRLKLVSYRQSSMLELAN